MAVLKRSRRVGVLTYTAKQPPHASSPLRAAAPSGAAPAEVALAGTPKVAVTPHAPPPPAGAHRSACWGASHEAFSCARCSAPPPPASASHAVRASWNTTAAGDTSGAQALALSSGTAVAGGAAAAGAPLKTPTRATPQPPRGAALGGPAAAAYSV